MITQAETKWTSVTNWAAIAGHWALSENNQRYEPPSGPAALPGAHGIVLSGERFRDGLIRCQMRFEDSNGPLAGGPSERGVSGGILLGYHSMSGSYLVAGLGAFDAAYAIWKYTAGLGWRASRSMGAIQNLRYSHDYMLEVTQRGQRVTLTVDQVPVLDYLLPSPLPGNQLGLYAMSRSPVQFRNFQIQRKPPTAFVAMQFGEPYDTIYRTVIKPKTQALGFEVVRSDEVNQPGIIFQDIQRKIEDAKVVIAEIRAPNQNVYYDVGYAHALNKPTIFLAQRGKDLPFDIRSYRVIFYEDSIGGKPTVEKSLREYLQAILQEI